ncbi:MAG: metallophosphoesterase [Methanomicrobiales archaeon]|nr:metallophosphoesterase [Methanomicrobiales archaeon]
MKIEFMPEGPALLLHNRMRVLAIADLHFGIEADLAARGVHIPSRGRERLERVLECIGRAEPDLLVVLGDLKHTVPRATWQERMEIPMVLERLRGRVPIRVAIGNHDAGLERYLVGEELMPARGGEVDGVWYMHGHTYPPPECRSDLIVLGHHHPMISLHDEVGCALHDRAYLLAVLDPRCLGLAERGDGTVKGLFMPAFNELGGFDALRLKECELGPISRCMDAEQAEVYLTDGTYLGTIAAIRHEGGTDA